MAGAEARGVAGAVAPTHPPTHPPYPSNKPSCRPSTCFSASTGGIQDHFRDASHVLRMLPLANINSPMIQKHDQRCLRACTWKIIFGRAPAFRQYMGMGIVLETIRIARVLPRWFVLLAAMDSKLHPSQDVFTATRSTAQPIHIAQGLLERRSVTARRFRLHAAVRSH